MEREGASPPGRIFRRVRRTMSPANPLFTNSTDARECTRTVSDDSSDGSPSGAEPEELECPGDVSSEDASEDEHLDEDSDDDEYTDDDEYSDDHLYYGDRYGDHSQDDEDDDENPDLQSDLMHEYFQYAMRRHAENRGGRSPARQRAEGWRTARAHQDGDRSLLFIVRGVICSCWFYLVWLSCWFCDGLLQLLLLRGLITGCAAIVWYVAEIRLSGLRQSAIPPIFRTVTKVLLLAEWAQSKARRVLKWFPPYLIALVLSLVVLLLHLVPLHSWCGASGANAHWAGALVITRPSTHYTGAGSWFILPASWFANVFQNPFSVTFETGNHTQTHQHEKCGPLPSPLSPQPSGRQCTQTELGGSCEQLVIADFPDSSKLIVIDGGPLTIDDVANDFDENRNGVLDRAEVSNLKKTLIQIFPERGAAAAAAATAALRDLNGSLTFQQHHAIWDQHFGAGECVAKGCRNVNQMIYTYQQSRGDLDDDAAIRQFERYIHLSLVQGVAWQGPIAWLGVPACSELRPNSWFVPWLLQIFWFISSFRSQIFFTSIFKDIPTHHGAANDVWVCRFAASLVTCFVVCLASSYGLVELLSNCLAISPIVFQSAVVVMHTLSSDHMDFLMQFELFCERLWTELENIENHDSRARQGYQYEEFAARMIRCPLCRHVSNQDRAIHNVKQDLAQTCCVCLTDPATTCLACGHLCLCEPCFERSCDHAA